VDASLASRDERGVARLAVGVIQDVTQEKLALQALRENERKLAQAVEARDEFLSVASHELRSPLTSVQLNVDILRRGARKADALPSARVLSGLEAIDRQLRRQVGLMDRLLDRFSELAQGAGSEISVRMPSSIPGSWDPMRIEQIVTNLLSNAIKYGAGKPIRVEASVEGDFALLSVADQGIGIAAEDLEKIFDRFERATRLRTAESLGLGLFIVKQLVQAHGGSIQVDSVPGQGSTFGVSLPRRLGEQDGFSHGQLI
jgi:signal transduction histidine kinase